MTTVALVASVPPVVTGSRLRMFEEAAASSRSYLSGDVAEPDIRESVEVVPLPPLERGPSRASVMVVEFELRPGAERVGDPVSIEVHQQQLGMVAREWRGR